MPSASSFHGPLHSGPPHIWTATVSVARRPPPAIGDATAAALRAAPEFVLYAMRDPASQAKLVTDQRAGLALIVDPVERECARAGVDPPIRSELLARIYVALFSGTCNSRSSTPTPSTTTPSPQQLCSSARRSKRLAN